MCLDYLIGSADIHSKTGPLRPVRHQLCPGCGQRGPGLLRLCGHPPQQCQREDQGACPEDFSGAGQKDHGCQLLWAHHLDQRSREFDFPVDFWATRCREGSFLWPDRDPIMDEVSRPPP